LEGGYSIYNENSIRDYQRHASQFTRGKSFPATGSFGHFLVTPDEVGQLAGQREYGAIFDARY